MPANEDTLLDQAGQRFVADKHCNVCAHHQSRRRGCGHIIETCHHPSLNPDTEWPEVDAGMVCDWFMPNP